MDAAARALDPRVRQVIATLGSEDVVVMIATPSGWTVGDVRPLTRLNVTVIAEDGKGRQIGSFGGGGRVALTSSSKATAGVRFALRGGAPGDHATSTRSTRRPAR